MSEGSDDALAPRADEAPTDDLEARRRRVHEKAEALRDRLSDEARRVDEARRDAHAFVVRHRWPLLGLSAAFGYGVARRRGRPEQRVVVVDSASKGSPWGALAGRVLEMAARAAVDAARAHLEARLIRTTDEADFGGEPAEPGDAPESTRPGPRTLRPPGRAGSGGRGP